MKYGSCCKHARMLYTLSVERQRSLRFRPFIRWAGGKQSIVRELLAHLPKDFAMNGNKYFEPFLGAGSLFLAACPHKAVLSDLNEHLVNCFRVIRDNPCEFHRLIKNHAKSHSPKHYYKTRERFNSGSAKSVEVFAAQFYYLNRMSFNGIYRVNQEGFYNVPIGNKKSVLIPDKDWLIDLSNVLEGVDFKVGDFIDALKTAAPGDFIYFDPPYPPLNETAYFTHYTKEKFNPIDQENLACVAINLNGIGCKVMISNADTPEIRMLYRGWSIKQLGVTRYVTCKRERRAVQELIIKNY